MNCLKHAIDQSLDQAYAHHIQRLMVTGNFALLTGIHPDEVDQWYLGIYIDAFEWVEITNTRGMSQFADGGIVGSKPYVSSASYIDKMSDYCQNCLYKKEVKIGEGACPFNSLYWNFFDANQEKLKSNPRLGMMFNVWNKMNPKQKSEILHQAEYYLENIERL
jgi:deoxyribodipyrimidine photolyase-related protein